MKKIIILLLPFLLFPFLISASDMDDNEAIYKNKNIQGCYDQGVSSYIEACMSYLMNSNKDKYESTYDKFLIKIRSSRESFMNYNDFMRSIHKEKGSWDTYIKYACLAKANLFEKDNYAYNIIHDECLARNYQERSKHYENYEFH